MGDGDKSKSPDENISSKISKITSHLLFTALHLPSHILFAWKNSHSGKNAHDIYTALC